MGKKMPKTKRMGRDVSVIATIKKQQTQKKYKATFFKTRKMCLISPHYLVEFLFHFFKHRNINCQPMSSNKTDESRRVITIFLIDAVINSMISPRIFGLLRTELYLGAVRSLSTQERIM